MNAQRVETLKKAAFLHDLGKLLNWSGELHLLDGARVLKYLGFDDTPLPAPVPGASHAANRRSE